MTRLHELPDLLTVDEAAAFLRIGRNAAYQAVQRGDLYAIRLGRSWRVPRASLERLVNGDDPAGEDGAVRDLAVVGRASGSEGRS